MQKHETMLINLPHGEVKTQKYFFPSSGRVAANVCTNEIDIHDNLL
jgi:hypothetical protein